ncbi:hypothetical protein FRC00_002557 [Tulasnella sp. 408]|nr:hypothetical protein FRC00_002557 [Tulasnella sp. 408]
MSLLNCLRWLATLAPDPAAGALQALNRPDSQATPPPDPTAAALRALAKPKAQGNCPAGYPLVATSGFIKRNKDLNSRMNEDNDFEYLNPDKTLARRQGQEEYDGDDDPWADPPEQPSPHIPDFPPDLRLLLLKRCSAY